MDTNKSQTDTKLPPTLKFEDLMLPQVRQTIFAIKSVLGRYIGMSHVRVILFQRMNATEEISQAEIQRQLGVNGAVVTRIIKQMEAEGLITRRANPVDNRYMLVRLTDVGRQRQEEVLAKIRKIESTLLQGLTVEEIRCTQRVLAQIRQNAESLTANIEDGRSHK
jgi:DNA-binding MarR family transcriptional regulator